ncbi:hypothetical protein [Phenylobacterium sp.]|uniref:hypothetical protein n=1 Tax=Phenylobacterium sp. TaxID=1871053 RepID=UPI002E381E8F|nr:hypothetical protein [Phenylobacterium sp.]HEX2561489.1 hypothetical protein [Phenylobacterium sp.]
MPSLIPIGSADDPRLEPYHAVRERDLVGRRGLFIAEGEVVLRILLSQSRHAPASLLLAEKRAAKLAPLIAGLSPDVPVYVAPQAVMDTVVGFPIHRGILAVARRAEPTDPAGLLAQLPAPALVLALVGIANHDNMAAYSATRPRSASARCCSTPPVAIRSTARPFASRSGRR